MNPASDTHETQDSAAVPATPAPTPAAHGHPRRPAQEALEPLALRHELRDFERFPIAPLLKAGKPHVYRQCVETMARTRDYADKNLVGQVERWDEEAGRDHDFVPWSAIDAALPYGFLRLNIPAVVGGTNFGLMAAAVFAEELAAADAGFYVIYGAHSLALSLLIASLDTGIIARIGGEIADGEKRGKPVILALAHTEAGGGSDVEDVDDLKTGRLASRFTKVPGGYRVTARKVFISNGSFARYNVLTAWGDLKRPLDTMAGFVIPNDARGFQVGRVEHKMGQRLSAACEILCDDVFVPDSHAFPIEGRSIDTTLSLTRGPVGAMSTGIIRGTLERTLAYLAQKRVRGRWLFEEQWVKLALADMLGALQAARGLYVDSALAGEEWGVFALTRMFPEHMPETVRKSRPFGKIMNHRSMVGLTRKLYRSQVPGDQLQRLVSHASLAKFMCSDLAVSTSMKAMEILGEDANNPRWGVEKGMRDAKLAQIFEGTNQINRLHVARGLLTGS
jgi:butyryl-CoA dehydrogenase